eukprot:c43180_g1_i1 orf=333-1166(+)
MHDFMNFENLLMECLRRSASAEHPTTVEIGLGSPLPTYWEQCLDLKSGVVYFKNRQTGSCICPDQLFTISSTSQDCFSCEDGLILRNRRWWDREKDLNYRLGSKARGAFPTDEKRHHSGPNSKNSSLDLDLRLAVKTEVGNYTCSSDSCLSVLNMEQWAPQPYKNPLPISSLSLDTLSSTSMCSSSSSSPSILSFEGDSEDENLEVESSLKFDPFEQEPIESMIAAGCVRCLMYVLLPRARPMCPKCGHAVLLNFPLPPVAADGSFHQDLHTIVLLR